jgi:hypothetical protein
MFLGWYDPTKKKPAREKLGDAIERYTEKFGKAPVACLVGSIDGDELRADPAVTIDVSSVHYIPRNTFYVGEHDEPSVTTP